MLRILRNAFAEEDKGKLSFNNMGMHLQSAVLFCISVAHVHLCLSFCVSVVADSARRSVASAFFEVLVLKTRGLVDVQQQKPYADILISKTVRCFTCVYLFSSWCTLYRCC